MRLFKLGGNKFLKSPLVIWKSYRMSPISSYNPKIKLFTKSTSKMNFTTMGIQTDPISSKSSRDISPDVDLKTLEEKFFNSAVYKQWEKVRECYEQMKKKSSFLPLKVYNTIVTSVMQEGNLQSLTRYMVEVVEEREILLSEVTLLGFFKFCWEKNDKKYGELAVRVFKGTKRIHDKVFQEQKAEKQKLLFNSPPEKTGSTNSSQNFVKEHLDISLYTSIIGIYVRYQMLEEAMSLLLELESHGVEIGHQTLSHVVALAYKKGGMQKALDKIEELRQSVKNKKTIEELFHSLVKICCDEHRTKDAEHVAEVMKSAGVKFEQKTNVQILASYLNEKSAAGTYAVLEKIISSVESPTGLLVTLFNSLESRRLKSQGDLLHKQVMAVCNSEFAKKSRVLLGKNTCYYNTVLKFKFAFDDFAGANKVLEEMLANNVVLDTYSASILLNGFGVKKGDLQKSESLIELFKKQNVVFATSVYSVLVKTFSNHKRFRDAVYYCRKMAEEQSSRGSISGSTLSMLCKSYSMVGDLKNAVSCFRQLLEDGDEPKKAAVLGMLHLYCSKNMFREAHSLLVQLVEQFNFIPTRPMLSLLIRCCPLDRLEEVHQWIKSKKWIECDNDFMNMLISRAGNCKDFGKALQYFEEMKKNGLKPNLVTFQQLMSCGIMCGQKESLKKIYKLMEEKKMLDEHTKEYLSCLWVDLHFKNGRKVAVGLEKVKHVKQNRLQYNYHLLIKYYAAAGDWGSAFSKYEQMKVHKVEVLEETMQVLIELFGKCKRESELSEMLREMVRCANKQEKHCIPSLVYAFCELDKIDRAMEYYNKLEKEEDQYSPEMQDVYDEYSAKLEKSTLSILSYHCRHGESEKVEVWKQKSISEKVFTIETANVLFAYYLKTKDLEKMEQLFSSLPDFSVIPDDFSFSCAFNLLSTDDEDGLHSAFEYMVKSGITHFSTDSPLALSLKSHLSNSDLMFSFAHKLTTLSELYPYNSECVRKFITAIQSN